MHKQFSQFTSRKVLLALFAAAALVAVTFIASINVAHAQQASGTCPAGYQRSGAVNANGTWTCLIQGGDLSGGNFLDFNADGTQKGSTVTGPSGGVTNFDAKGKEIPSRSDCSSFILAMKSPFTCLMRSATTWIATGIIYLAVTALEFVGWFFDIAVSQTVLQFNSWISGSVLDAISLGWGFFRDIANIAIIGLFVFIAIGIILGLKDYGQRRLIANVLIVAILINFSFLFTRIIINFSNSLAIQFAKPMQISNSQLNQKPTDVAGKFTRLMGVGDGLFKTQDALKQIANDQDSTWVALGHALIVLIIILGAALVLLYGAILLIVRAVVLVFLMLTSSFAFATYIHPSLASKEFGWSAWWEALIRNAILAPAMMLMLYLVLTISEKLVSQLGGQAGTGVLGGLASNPSDPKNVSALLLYAVILGLLYGAIRISSMFSGLAGHVAMSLTAPIAGRLAGYPMRGVGFLGRNTIGRGAARLSGALQNQSTPKEGRSLFYRKSMDALAQLAKKPAQVSFNPANATNFKAGQSKDKSFDAQQKRVINDFAAQAKRMTPDDKGVQKLLEQNRANAAAERASDVDAKQKLIEAARAGEQSANKLAENAQKNAENLQKEMTSLVGKIDAIKANPALAADEKKKLLENEETVLQTKKTEHERQSRLIKDAQKTAQEHSQKQLEAHGELAELKRRIEQTARNRMAPGDLDNHGNVIPKNVRMENTAVELAHDRVSNIIPRVFGSTVENDDLAQQMRRKGMTDYLHREKLREEREERKHIDHEIDAKSGHANDNKDAGNAKAA